MSLITDILSLTCVVAWVWVYSQRSVRKIVGLRKGALLAINCSHIVNSDRLGRAIGKWQDLKGASK